MSAPRILVVEGNTAEGRARHAAVGGKPAGEHYANVLRQIMPGLVADICYPADAGANLPDRAGIEGYDGVVITGSALNAYDRTPPVTRQVDLARAVFSTETPFFGSCWGLQIATVALGGVVRRHPQGREVGIARAIRLTQEGVRHPLYDGKPSVFDAIAVHMDDVETAALGTTVLATNDWSPIQAAEIKTNACTFWGVQYHPEYTFGEIAAVMRRIAPSMLEQGLFHSMGELNVHVAELDTLHRNPADKPLRWRYGVGDAVADFAKRTREIRNWLTHQVLPTRSRRGRE